MTKKSTWVDPVPWVVFDTERQQVVARATTKALAEEYAKSAVDNPQRYTISKP